MPDFSMMSPLHQATLKGTMEAFGPALDEVVKQGALPHDTSLIVAEIAKKDNGILMKRLLEAAFAIKQQRGANDLDAQLASGEIDTNSYTELDFRACLNYAGIGDRQGIVKPSLMYATTHSPQFAEAIKNADATVSSVLGNLLIRNGDQTRRITPILEEIERTAPENAAVIARNTILASLQDDTNCFNAGARESFALIAAQLDPQGVDDVLAVLVRQQGGKSDEFDARQKMILDRASPEALKAAHRSMAAAGSAGTFAALSDRLQGELDPKESLLAACGEEFSESKTAQAKARSLENLRTILQHEFSDDDIFAAIEAAIGAKKDGHLSALLDYAKDKCPAIVKRHTSDNSTLLIKALSVKNGKSYDKNDNPLVERMAFMLLQLDTVSEPDSHGNHPLSILSERGMEHSGTYRAISKVLDNEIDLQYVGKRVTAELQAKLAIVQQLQAMNMDPSIIAALLGAPAAPPQPQSPTRSLPSMGPHSARIVEKGDGPIPGGHE